jgi:hypothetical protein
MPALQKCLNGDIRLQPGLANAVARLCQERAPHTSFDLANHAFGDLSKRLPVLKILACRFHGSTMPWGSAHVAEADG